MPEPREPPPARTFYLNEQHELARGEKPGGGRLPKLQPLNWQSKGQRIHQTLESARRTILNSEDPLRESRYFLATLPEPHIRKRSDNRRLAPKGTIDEETDYAGQHSQLFKRLGLDLLAVDSEGRALVHAPSSRMVQLLSTAANLSAEGPREQARWVAIESFAPAPASFRVDAEWLESLQQEALVDAVIELQPLLTRVEVEQVVHAILERMQGRKDRERLTRMGTDFSGRHWYRGMLSQASVRWIADRFYSVQALHPPLQTAVVATSPGRRAGRRSGPAATPSSPIADASLLPVVAVVDVGVPEKHLQLAPYRRGGYVGQDVPSGIRADHGSLVASGVVFGDPDFSSGVGTATADCAFLDVNIAADAAHIDDKAVTTALQAVVSTSPDVRVFNLSFGDFAPLDSQPPVQRPEKMFLVQDLDNFIFRNDVVVVIAAGNSAPGLQPHPDYPGHCDDPNWALGGWASGFNTLTCGSYVGRLNPGGLVKAMGWPSPFTRVGPGICAAPIPEFSANGGNCSDQYQPSPGLGVWACSADGRWEDHFGTSYAAPLLAREAAFAVAELQRRCEQGARPFAATVKAFLALTAAAFAVEQKDAAWSLAERTLGRGTAKADRLRAPSPESAVMVWQGVLGGPDDVARVQVPVPSGWLREASEPTLRVVAAWESPVNEAAENLWASRKVELQLRAASASQALRPRGRSHVSYPLLDRRYDLRTESLAKHGVVLPESDQWLLELSYKEIAAYTASIEFSPHQRVGLAMELFDAAEKPVSPQGALVALPQAVTMTRLSIPENRIANPIMVKPRI